MSVVLSTIAVIPAKAGIQLGICKAKRDARFRGHDALNIGNT